MAKQLGTNVDSEDVSMVASRKEFDEKKKALADAFARKARALAEIEDISGKAGVGVGVGNVDGVYVGGVGGGVEAVYFFC